MKRVLGQVRRAVQDYNMIGDGDRIAVGVSGGKDSQTLLTALSRLKGFYPKKFELEAVTIHLGMGEPDYSPVEQLCERLGVRYTMEKTWIGRIVFDERKEKNPCSLCANLRRGALNKAALRLGCNKVALAHHMDDVIETLLLCTFYEGRISTFSPVTHLDRSGLTVIRPLIYIEEREIKEFIKLSGITPVRNPCPANGNTARQRVKDLLSGMQKETRDIRQNVFGAIRRSALEGWNLRET